jgi:formate dehydrogenase beta subunit
MCRIDKRFKVPWAATPNRRWPVSGWKSNSVLMPLTAFKEASRCLNCDVQTVFNRDTCIECDACVDICPMDCITFTDQWRRELICGPGSRHPRPTY